jgi:hypothetical protein
MRCRSHIEETLFKRTAPDEIAAIFIEPVQGEGGYHVTPPCCLPALELYDKHGIMLVCDEVQCGMGHRATPTNTGASSRHHLFGQRHRRGMPGAIVADPRSWIGHREVTPAHLAAIPSVVAPHSRRLSFDANTWPIAGPRRTGPRRDAELQQTRFSRQSTRHRHDACNRCPKPGDAVRRATRNEIVDAAFITDIAALRRGGHSILFVVMRHRRAVDTMFAILDEVIAECTAEKMTAV